MLGKLTGAVLALSLLSGCASIVEGTVQTVKIEAKLPDGTLVEGADCELSNDEGKYRVTTPGYVEIRRSLSQLKINCVKGRLYAANARGKPFANAGMLGNVLFFGGVAGVTIDHFRGTGYSYPEWMQLVFGKYLVFSRFNDSWGMPSVGIEQNSYP